MKILSIKEIASRIGILEKSKSEMPELLCFDDNQLIELFDKFRDCLLSADPAVEANRQALLDRSNVGIVKYGTTLMDNKGDLRYWLNHALEECLDQANYLRRAIMEIDNGKN